MPELRYEEHRPPPRLRRFVRCVWTLSSSYAAGGSEAAAAPATEDRVLPDGCAEIVLHHGAVFERQAPGDDEATTQHRHAVIGQIESALRLRPTGPVGILGIRLEPWAAGPFLGVPAHDLTGRSVALEDLWGRDEADLAAAVQEAGDDGSRVAAALARAMTTRARRNARSMCSGARRGRSAWTTCAAKSA